MREVMQLTSERGVVLPLRQFMNVPGTAGKLGLMPGYIARPAAFGVKIVSKFPRPPGAARSLIYPRGPGWPIGATLKEGALLEPRASGAPGRKPGARQGLKGV
jgi:hypothetical protein